MKTNSFIAIAFTASVILLSACKSRNPKQPVPTQANQTETAKNAPGSKYTIKSGIVEYKTQMMGMDIKQILTFDDYGKKEVTDVVMEMMGTKVHSITLTKDGYLYKYDEQKKTGTKKPFIGGSASSIDFENLTDMMIKEMNLKKLGTEQFLGKTCEKMSIDYEKMKMKGSYLVYKGVALKMDTDMGTVKISMTGEKFVENAEIPASKFEIPADVKITESL
jgi:hypothetical protein